MPLPKDLQDIVWEYIISFQIVLSRPKLKALRKHVKKSNQDIMERYLINKLLESDGFLSYTILNSTVDSLLHNHHELQLLMRSVGSSLRHYASSSIVKWSFMKHDLCLVPGYFELFQKSLVFQVISQAALTL